MGDLFSNRKQSVCDKSLLRVRGNWANDNPSELAFVTTGHTKS